MTNVATAPSTKFESGKTYQFTHPKKGLQTVTDQTAFDVAAEDFDLFEIQTATTPTTPTNRNRPQRKRAESWEAAKSAQDERFAENLGVPSNIAEKGIDFEFVGTIDTAPPIQEFNENGKVRYQKVSCTADIDGKKTPFCLLFNPATQTPGAEVRVRVVALDKSIAVSGRGLEQI